MIPLASIPPIYTHQSTLILGGPDYDYVRIPITPLNTTPISIINTNPSSLMSPDDAESIQAAYAPTGRALCRYCKEKIAAESIRLAYHIDAGSFSSTHWYHLHCFELKPKFKDIDPIEEIYNLDQIDQSQADLDRVLAHIDAEKGRLKRGDKFVKPQHPSTKQKKKEPDGEANVDDGDASKTKPSKKQQKKTKQAEKAPQAHAYCPQQMKEYEQLLEKYGSQSVQSLKQLLMLNNQPRTGNKTELAEKCADGKILGQIPRCPNCGGGRPKFNKEASTYKCSGFMDDDKFRNCNKTFQMGDIKREKWID